MGETQTKMDSRGKHNANERKWKESMRDEGRVPKLNIMKNEGRARTRKAAGNS
jgi:hypothetical protein